MNTFPGVSPTGNASSTSRLSTASTQLPGSSVGNCSNASSPASQSSTQDVVLMRNRIKELEEQLSKATSSKSTPQSQTSPLNSEIETATSQIGGTYYFHIDSPQGLTRSVTHKTRLFGQSHWIVGMSLVGQSSLFPSSLSPFFYSVFYLFIILFFSRTQLIICVVQRFIGVD